MRVQGKGVRIYDFLSPPAKERTWVLLHAHTKSTEGKGKISIKMPKENQLTPKGNSLIHSSVAIYLALVPTAWPQTHALKEPLQEATASATGSAPQNPVLLLSYFQHHMWGWPWVKGEQKGAGQELCEMWAKLPGRDSAHSAGEGEMCQHKGQLQLCAYQEILFTEHLAIDKIKGFSSQLST